MLNKEQKYKALKLQSNEYDSKRFDLGGLYF
jgi:hypothetical protein